MTTIGRLAVKISADASGLNSGLRDAGKSVSDFDAQATALGDKLKGFLAPAAVAAGLAFAGKMLKNVADTADALAKLSQKTGVAVEDLSRLQYAAGMAGVSNDQLSAGITRLSRGMSEASQGTGEAAKAFDAMGLSVTNADGTLKNQRQMLEEIADRFSKYEDGAQKSALAQQIFGRSGAELIPLLNSGAQGLRDMADESDALGNTIDTKTAKAAEQFNDNITRLNTALGGMARTIAGPVIQSLADFTNEAFKAWREGHNLLTMIEHGFKRLAAAQTIEEAERKVADLTREYEAAKKSVAHLEEWEQATAGIMRLGKQVEYAKNRLKELRAERALSNTEGNQSDAEARRLGLAGGRTAAPMLPASSATAGRSAGGRAAGAATAKEGMGDDPFLARLEQWRQANDDALTAIEEREAQAFATRLDSLRNYVKTEEQITLERHAAQRETLLMGFEQGLVTQQEYMLMEQDLAMKHMEELERIRSDGERRIAQNTAASWAMQAQTVAAKIGEMTAAASSGSRAMFSINKAAAISNILLKGRESIMSARAFGTSIGGPVLGAIMGGLEAAAVASQVSAVKSQKFGGGGGVSSAGGSVAPTQSAAAGGMGGSQTITVQGIGAGDLFSGDSVRVLIDRLIDAQRNGARIVLT